MGRIFLMMRRGQFFRDVLILLLLMGLLFYGASWQMFHTDSDASRYQCYAVAFWQGWLGLLKLPSRQCLFIFNPDPHIAIISQNDLLSMLKQWRMPRSWMQFVGNQSSFMPYHTLPYEYPWLVLIPYSLPLLVIPSWYQVAFAIEMLLLACCVYFVLQRFRSRRAALAFALYLVVGGWSTVAGRFDLVPASLTLFAIICASKKHWNWAFALLALATLSKFYPAILFIPFFIALQRDISGKWYYWRRWLPIGIFMGICLLVIFISLLLSVVGTLTPLSYFKNRPIQVESLSASLLWLIGRQSLSYAYTFSSLNIISPLSGQITLVITLLLIICLINCWYLQWRGSLDLATSSLLTLVIVIITGKIFSPQYLIWIIPLAAYVGQTNRWWLLFWTTVCVLTTWVYPSMYNAVSLLLIPSLPQFFPVTVSRNVLLLGFVILTLIKRSRLDHPHEDDAESILKNGMDTQ